MPTNVHELFLFEFIELTLFYEFKSRKYEMKPQISLITRIFLDRDF